ncbi:MAG TPA: MFS transporter [Pyrinomonadaceae bacterium]|jgi:UMF1 family MFS transporter|nr:MFS transporter [Pyrinomonadaceae bacterium]
MKKNDRKEIFGWMLYDWANSAFFTTIVGVLVGPYLLGLAQKAVGEDGVILDLGLFNVTPKGLPAFCTAIAVASLVMFLPLLGAIADYTHLKKLLMAVFCYIGVIAAALLFFVTESYVACSVLFIISTMTFAAANVFYNAFLIDITTEDMRDKVSSYGYGLGYLSGFIMLVLNLIFISNAESLGFSTAEAVRICFLAAALWWGVFAIGTFYLLRSRGAVKHVPADQNIVTVGFAELWQTLKELRRLRYTMLFLIAYLFYNDGIQTVILQSSVFISYELFTSKGLENDNAFLITMFAVAQISAFAGALIFERIARRLGAKSTIMVSLFIWCAIVIYGFALFESKTQAYIMGGVIGMVLGAAQALSRSLYSQMIPAGRESAFFGLYEISEKGTSWMGQLMFTIIVGATGSFRYAILGLIVFFVVGSVLLFFTNTERAVHEAGNLTPEEAAGR